MKFPTVMESLRAHLKTSGFEPGGPGIFVRPTGPVISSWISVSGNSALLNIAVGIVSPPVIRMMQRALLSVSDDARGEQKYDARLGPPMLMMSLGQCAQLYAPERSWNTLLRPPSTLTAADLSAAIEALDVGAMKFFETYSDLTVVLGDLDARSALSIDQLYLVAAAAGVLRDTDRVRRALERGAKLDPESQRGFEAYCKWILANEV